LVTRGDGKAGPFDLVAFFFHKGGLCEEPALMSSPSAEENISFPVDCALCTSASCCLRAWSANEESFPLGVSAVKCALSSSKASHVYATHLNHFSLVHLGCSGVGERMENEPTVLMPP